MEFLWQPYFPPLVTIATALLVIALAGWSYVITRRRGSMRASMLFLLRCAIVGATAFFLMGPSRLPPAQTTNARPHLELWMDTSASMQTSDMDELSRIEFARKNWLSPALLSQLSLTHDISAIKFGSNVRSAPLTIESLNALTADDPNTSLVRGLTSHLIRAPSDGHLRHALLLTDGIDSENTRHTVLTDAARAKKYTIHTVALGGPRMEQDVSIFVSPRQDSLMVDEEGALMVRVMQSNIGRREVVVRIDDGVSPREVRLRFSGEPFITFDVPVRHEQPGTFAYSFHVDPVPREIETRNNHQEILVPVSPKRFRVLMVEGSPGWDTKFIAHTLRADSRIELLQVSQLSATRREILSTRIPSEESTFPQTDEELSRFDAVIVGRSPELVGGADWLRLLPPYVLRHGGGVLWARGPPDISALEPGLAESLQKIIPVRAQESSTPFDKPRLFPSALGRFHAAFIFQGSVLDNDQLRRLPTLTTMVPSKAMPAAEVLAVFTTNEEPDRSFPALVSMPCGTGRAMLFAGEGLWRWRMLDASLADLKDVYENFWGNLVRQLVTSGEFMPGQEIGMMVTPANARVGETFTVAVSTRTRPAQHTAQPQLFIQFADGRREQLALTVSPDAPNRLLASWKAEREGMVSFMLEAPGYQPERIERRGNVYDVDIERTQSAARPDILERIARLTGGSVLDPRQPEHFPALLSRTEATRETPPTPELIWNREWVMVLLLLCAGMEWILRKSWGWT